MARWRNIKKGTTSNKSTATETPSPIICAPILSRIKAFITDMFMMMMPIMYITTYIILDGKEDLQASELARWITMLVFGIITIILWVKKAQTPGLKAYSLKLVNSNDKTNISFTTATIRYILFLISCVSIIGVILPFFRKDKKTFQDLATNTCVIIEEKKV